MNVPIPFSPALEDLTIPNAKGVFEMAKLLCQEGVELYPRFRERIVRLETHASDIGWGYGDDLREQVYFLEDELTDD